jgi:amino acid adenylation domain-containing protein
VEPVEEKEYYPLSAAQKRMYILNLFIEYNIRLAFQVEGNLDRKRFGQVFRRLVQRHESLRTSFETIGGEPVQRIHDRAAPDVEYHDLGARGHEVNAIISQFFRAIDLSVPPLLRVGLIKLAETRYVYLLNIHHIAADGTSIAILAAEFLRLYMGEEPPGLKIRYKDYCQWQDRLFAAGEYRKKEAYWLGLFSGGLPVLEMPTDFPRPAVQSFAGARIRFSLEGETFRALKALSIAQKASIQMILNAVYNTLLFRCTGQEDIVVGMITAGRERMELEPLFGVFINTLALRNYPGRCKPFSGFLEELKQHTLAAYENRSYPFGDLLEKVVKKKDLSRNPLFDVMLIFQNVDMRTRWELQDLGFALSRYEYSAGRDVQQDIALWASVEEEQVRMDLDYCTALFTRETMERFAVHFVTLLRGALSDPKQELSQLEMLGGEEKRQILEQFNNTEIPFSPGKTVHELFACQAERTPDRIALVGSCLCARPEGVVQHLGYNELNQRSDRLAFVLREKGVLPDSIVGIMMERSLEMIIGVLGILKAGGAYLPIDPDYPRERIDYMLKDSGAKILLTDLPEGCYIHHSSNRFITHHPGSIAYVIYTSGTTGRPKGVLVEQGNLAAYLTSFQREFAITPRDVVLQQASYSFDAFAEEVYPCLTRGGVMVIPGKDEIRDIDCLIGILIRHNVTVIDCSPLLLAQLNLRLAGEFVPGSPVRIRLFISGGDVLRSEYIENLLTWGEVYNTYGPTETTICAAYYRCLPGGSAAVPIGKPIANYRIYILDKCLRLLPVGIPGEICISGVGAARGYLNRPGLTAEKFISAPATSRRPQPGYVFYRSYKSYRTYSSYKTGDLGRWRADGTIEFLGRLDLQVKVRGYRIEPEEIERCLSRHPDTGGVVVVLRSGSICAYFTASADKEITVRQLREFLAGKLPDYMIPAYFVRLERIPLTPSGKVNRRDLPDPGDHTVDTGIRYAAPRDETESQIVRIWGEVLHVDVDRIGIYDNFFELGGNSITANQVVARMREEYQVEISIRKLFESPTPDALAREAGKERKGKTAGIGRVPRNGNIPLSFPQERLWFLHQLDENAISYHVPRLVRIRGKLDVALLERTFNEIIRRHEILRTVFPTVDGRPVQEVREPFEIKIPVIDLSGIAEGARAGRTAELTLAEGRKRFDFVKGPLIRVSLLKLKEEEYLLMSTEHHFIHDGWTQGVLLKEFITIYRAFSGGKPSPLPELPIQYPDFAAWQRNYMQGEVLERHVSYWQKKLAGLPPLLELPADRPRPHVVSGRGAALNMHLSESLSSSLKAFSKENGVTLFITMLTVFKVLLYRYTGREDLCVGTGIANRRHKEVEMLIGMVINTLPLRTFISGHLTVGQCLRRIKNTCIDAYEHEDTPFEKIVEALRPERTLSYNPVFQVLFSFMDTPTEYFSLPGLEVNAEPTHNRSSKFDLNVVVLPPPEELVEEIGSRIYFEWEYNTDIFGPSTIDRMVGHYIRLLELFPRYAGKPVFSLPMLSEAEIHQLVHEWNDTAVEYPHDKTLHELFAEQASRTPDSVALAGSKNKQGQTALTYGELNKRSGWLARSLRERGVQPDGIVGIMMERSIEMIIGILGILKAGGAYLPIDPGYPEERKRYMLADSGAKILLSELSEVSGLIKEPTRLTHPAHPAHLCYVIYTSGSTGKPKGVLITHANISPLLHWGYRDTGIGPGDRTIQNLAYIFDWSVWEIFITLTSGACFYIVPDDILLDPEACTAFIREHGITVLHATPSQLGYLAGGGARFETLRYLFIGAEKLGHDLVTRSFALVNAECRVFNMYGPTEAAIISAVLEIHRVKNAELRNLSSVPIGKPIANAVLFILDRYLQLCPVKVSGELYIGGDGLAPGYLNNPELTAEKFIEYRSYRTYRTYSFRTYSFYKTGDMVRWLADGNIEFLGRIDFQVKIRGFRIETGEIEHRLLTHPGVNAAAVTVGENEDADRYLCAYVVSGVGPGELKEYLSRSLPGYMVPTYFMAVEKIPLTPNGKVDTKALPTPVICAPQEYEAPRNEIEARLVDIWSEILQVDRAVIGINNNFFDLGGHSLKATLLAARIHEVFHVDVPLAELFINPTIRAISELAAVADWVKHQDIPGASESEEILI